eukprot:TRINITY_DN4272_c0_g1_i1.p1 TRINITY_DN4272_c0_g1~~TRINITY_DN4272_c0_g1_i1.p1  ORF type:complete len:250 (+),score=109.33 TRINITY_DN4272_c0_g1_i1:77-751(+)
MAQYAEVQALEQALPEEEKNRLLALFRDFDKDNSGTLDKAELKSLLEATLNRSVSESLLNRYIDLQFNASDKDFNGVIDFPEFCSLYSKIYKNPELPIHMGYKEGAHKFVAESGESAPKVPTIEVAELTPQELEECRNKFNEADKDNSGTVDKAELRELLKFAMGKRMSPMMADRFINAEFDKWDKDNSGEIDFDEFTNLYRSFFLKSSSPAGGIGIGMPPPGF